MNRLTKAWKALRGTLEPELRYLPDPDRWLNLYRVQWWQYRFGKSRPIPREFNEYFHSCHLALSAHPDKKVSVVVAVQVDGKFYRLDGLVPVDVEPKPKRPKGKASA